MAALLISCLASGGSDEAATSCHISGTCGTTTPPCGSVGKLHLVRLCRTRVCV